MNEKRERIEVLYEQQKKNIENLLEQIKKEIINGSCSGECYY